VQLYKMLEVQFLSGLEDTHSIMPEINVDVVLRNKELMLKPSLEELKEKYYKEITNYLLWPSRVFKGINGNLDIYHKLGDNNIGAIKLLISKAETLFALLATHLRSLAQWALIPHLSTANIADTLKTTEEWELNVRAIRMKRKEL
jgi:dynein heavy chain 2